MKTGYLRLDGYYNGHDYGRYIISKQSQISDSIQSSIFLFWDDCIFQGYLVTLKDFKKVSMVRIFNGISCDGGEMPSDSEKEAVDYDHRFITKFTSDTTFNVLQYYRFLWEYKDKSIPSKYLTDDSSYTEYSIIKSGQINANRKVFWENGKSKR